MDVNQPSIPWVCLLVAAGVALCSTVQCGVRAFRNGRERRSLLHSWPPAAGRQIWEPIANASGSAVKSAPVRDPPAIVGPSAGILVGPTPDGPVQIGPSEAPVVVVGPASVLIVEPPPRGAWDERGWTVRRSNSQATYEGYYHVLDRRTSRLQRYAGRVVARNGRVVPYIADPPHQIKRHPKGPCFKPWNLPWFCVEWRRPATNVDDAILYVEKVLDEALNG